MHMRIVTLQGRGRQREKIPLSAANPKRSAVAKGRLRLTNREGVDIVFEKAGSSTVARYGLVVWSHGQISLLGLLTDVSEPLNLLPIIARNIRLGIDVGSVAKLEE